ncbi:hypothetical protein Moror_12337 [Moniliophthora roreri MCA 2997]|uniref:Uncharacterized protein n=1 Tax=Moniliophthora roreri (strain MCA 2997) TaxID=1381753 RepID=V2YVW8_MONRO|nr:hypothetical protein Moror_12337 [Moniliophthora roreri MCA 2997]
MTRKKTSTSSSRPLHIGNSQSQSNQTKVSGNGKRTRDKQATSDLEERSTSQKTEKRAKVTKSHKGSCNDGKLSRFLGDLPMDLWTVLCVVLPEPVPSNLTTLTPRSLVIFQWNLFARCFELIG